MIVKVSKGRKRRDPATTPDPDGIQYDGVGRMKYHPDFHENHGLQFTEEELCYLVKFYKYDGRRAMSFALGKTELVVQNKYLDLQKRRLIPYYKSLDYYC